MHSTVRAALKVSEDSLEHERARAAAAEACTAEVGARAHFRSELRVC